MVPSGQAKRQAGRALQSLPPDPLLPAPPGAISGALQRPPAQTSPRRTALQSASVRHSATQMDSLLPQLASVVGPQRAIAAWGQLEGSVHAVVHVPQMQSSPPHSASVLHRLSQCVALSVPVLGTVLPQAKIDRHRAKSKLLAATTLESRFIRYSSLLSRC